MYIDEFLLLAVLPWAKAIFLKSLFRYGVCIIKLFQEYKSRYGQQKAKSTRLLRSSAAVLNYLKQNNFDQTLIKIYTLKNINRQIAYKEVERTKSVKDIFKYAKEVFFNIQPDWRIGKKISGIKQIDAIICFIFL